MKNLTKVKICGITDYGTAAVCVQSGSDYIGFNFVSSSQRYCDVSNALKILQSLQKINKAKKTKYVGVFQDEEVIKVNKIANILDLDFVQLHGEEDDNYINNIEKNIIKKLNKLKSIPYHNKIEYMLLDRAKQGQGAKVSVNFAREISKKFSTFVAGGLTSENVKNIVKTVHPFAVDVASGVETNGKKDPQKIVQFIIAAKGGNIR